MNQLKKYAGELSDLNAVLEMLSWDQQVYLPEKSGTGRALQIQTIAALEHEKATSPVYEKLLTEAEKTSYDPESAEYALLRILRRSFEKDRRVPVQLVGELAKASSSAQELWLKAREENRYEILAPQMERIVELKREYAACFPEFKKPYDALLDDYEEAMTTDELDQAFLPLGTEQSALVREITANGIPDDSFLRGVPYDPRKQLEFCRFAVGKMGYDWTRGRLDMTEHPFTTSFGLYDVRITTNIKETEPLSGFFSCIHEAGHAVYEQNVDKTLDRTPMAGGASLGFHESQSRFWENMIGKSRAFWEYFFPEMLCRFPEQLKEVSPNRFYEAVNKVQPDYIRTEADEATYNLHIILRFELEKALFNDNLSVRELKDLWNAKTSEYLGLPAPDDRHGILQDIHWPDCLFGYFPTYALGNLIGAQILETMKRELPGFDSDVRNGNLLPILRYLTGKLYRFGAKYSAKETMKRVLGSNRIDSAPYLNYLKNKFTK